ncbi:MAG: OsmC family protein [Bacteroidota bacterium]
MQTKTAIVKQVQGVTLLGKSDSNHWVVMDGSEKFGGSSAGSSPKELLLMALGGCTANDVIPILTKKRIQFDHIDIHLTATAREEQPQVFTSIHIEYVVYGEDIDPSAIERAIELSTTKYCSISAMLGATAKITHSYRIEPVKTLVESD